MRPVFYPPARLYPHSLLIAFITNLLLMIKERFLKKTELSWCYGRGTACPTRSSGSAVTTKLRVEFLPLYIARSARKITPAGADHDVVIPNATAKYSCHLL